MKKLPYIPKNAPYGYHPLPRKKIPRQRDASRDHLTLDHALAKIRKWGEDKKNGKY